MNFRLRAAQTKKRRVLLAAGLIITGVALPGLPAGTAGAQETTDLTTLTAVAVASGQRASVFTTGLQAVSDFFDGFGPVAESKLDGLSGGQSFASVPYPGTTIVQYPAYVALAAEGQEVPGYPFYVSAHPGAPEAKQADPTGTYLLEAKANRETASSIARLRSSVGETAEAGSVSTTSIRIESGKVVATAESLTDGLAIGALKIGSVYSKAVTTYGPGNPEPQTVTELRIDGGAVNDQRFSFGPDGLTVTQQGVPVPVSQGVEVLNEVLGQDGISVRFVASEKIPGGAQAGTFEVSATRKLPGGGSGVVRMRFGQAIAAVVPGGDFVPTSPSDGTSGSSEVSPPADTTLGSDALTGPPSLPGPESAFAAGTTADLSLPESPSFGGIGLDIGAATDEPAVTADAAASTPEVALVTPRAPAQNARRAGRLAAATTLRAVDGVYAAVAWATIAVLALSLFWRQGARKWTS